MRIFCNSYPCTTINKLHTLTSFKKIFGSGLSLHILFLIFFLIGIYPDFAMFSEIKASDLYLPLILSVSSVAQSCLTLCDPMECRTPGFMSITNSWSLLKLISVESVMASNHLILCCSLYMLP